MHKITVFTSPKPFTKSAHINMIQRNAIGSWAHLGGDVVAMVIGDEEGTAETAADFGILHARDVRCNSLGTPYIPAMVELARQQTDSDILAFVNADVILTQKFVEEVQRVAARLDQFLLVGQRYDLKVNAPLDFSTDWQKEILALNMKHGRLHGPSGSDYFVFPRTCYTHIPELVIGRAGWDNWMIYEARQRGWKTIDCTASIPVIHQNHDYSHLPGGQIHFRLPESNENVKAAGGFLHIFPLTDADYFLSEGAIERRKTTWKNFWREIEILPLVRWHSDAIGKVFFYLAHPKRGWAALIGWVQRRAAKWFHLGEPEGK
ncbi:MAG: hypothetical protein HPY85_02260 [Anaerolineae bacterium]|nr:hypothetical protein [Anaerolineae bacterium]